jgi:hypothetical protein
MHMLHWKRNSLRALWMGQKLERTSLFCRRFCPEVRRFTQEGELLLCISLAVATRK